MTRENSKKKPAILIIDDEEQIRSLLKDLLSAENDCTTAGSAEEALAILKRINFNLVVSDINMGGISGLELVPRVLGTDSGHGRGDDQWAADHRLRDRSYAGRRV